MRFSEERKKLGIPAFSLLPTVNIFPFHSIYTPKCLIKYSFTDLFYVTSTLYQAKKLRTGPNSKYLQTTE